MNNFDQYIIVHGCPPSKERVLPCSQRWMNWVAERLVEVGYPAIAPEMPTPWNPVYTEWKAEIEKYAITENSLLVGHSCGAAFLVRWLLDTGKRVKKLILVAPAKIPETETDVRQSMYEFDLPSGASGIADEILIFISNDLPHNMKSFELYNKALHPRVVRLENKVHFLIFTMGTREFPELLQEVLK